MATVDLVLDLGSSYITIFKSGEGIVLREPSLVLISGNPNGNCKILEYGSSAKNMVSKLPDGYQLLYPIQEGAITYKKATKSMLLYFISKVVRRSDYFFKPKIRAFVNVPCGCQKEEREIIEEVLNFAGVQEVYLVEAPIFSAFGAFVPISASRPQLVVDIGGGITDIALVSEAGIQYGASYGIGGLAIDKGIIEGLESSIMLHVGLITSENLKTEIGSLYENENSEVTVYGKNVTSNNPKSSFVTTKHIRPMLEYFYGKIADVILSSMKELPEDTLNYLFDNGIIVCGGGAKMPGLSEFLKKRIKAPIYIPQRPELCAVNGGANLLSNAQQMNVFLKIE